MIFVQNSQFYKGCHKSQILSQRFTHSSGKESEKVQKLQFYDKKKKTTG